MYQTAMFMDDLPRPLWILLIVLGFYLWWPVGLALLLYRLSAKKWARNGGYANARACNWKGAKMGRYARGFSYAPPSGNEAFDAYRSETLRRLEDEQKEFVEYLERLRQARDRQEFEQFMNERRNRQTPAADQPQP